MSKAKPKFLRRSKTRYAKLGKGVKKNQKWRRPTGRDNKMRERRKGKPVRVSIGYKQEAKEQSVIVKTIKELREAKDQKVIIGNVGSKKKIELVKKAKEEGTKLENVNIDKFLKELEKKSKKKSAEEKK